MAGKKPGPTNFKSKAEEAEAREKARLQKYVVVQKGDARVAKYNHTPGGEGFSLEHSQRMAIPAHPDQPAYGLITVQQYEFIKDHPEPLTSQEAVNLFAREGGGE